MISHDLTVMRSPWVVASVAAAPVTIRKVKKLPRNAVGKVLKKDLEKMFQIWLSTSLNRQANRRSSR